MAVSMAHVRTIPAPVLKELSGVSASQFARLVDEVGREWDARRHEPLYSSHRGRLSGDCGLPARPTPSRAQVQQKADGHARTRSALREGAG